MWGLRLLAKDLGLDLCGVQILLKPLALGSVAVRSAFALVLPLLLCAEPFSPANPGANTARYTDPRADTR